MQAQLSETARAGAKAAPSSAQQEAVDAAQVAPDDPRQQAIRQAAYAQFEARGCVYGHELEDWLKAEAEVDAQVQRGLADPPSVAAPAQTSA